MIYIYAQFYWYLVLSILYVVLCLLLFYNSTQAARRERQVPHSSAGMGQCPRKISMSWTCPGHCPGHVPSKYPVQISHYIPL